MGQGRGHRDEGGDGEWCPYYPSRDTQSGEDKQGNWDVEINRGSTSREVDFVDPI